MNHEGPVFNLKAVVQQTGIKPDTLRAWERRYGLPAPNRSAGRHRLYSQHDIEIVKWLVARQREGLSISRAVDVWHQFEEEGTDPLYAPTPISSPAPVPAAAPSSGNTIVSLREAWLNACMAYDEQGAEHALTEAFALYPPETVCIEVLQKALEQVGECWYRGTATVQQEHFASALAVRRLESLIMAAPPATHGGRILAACPADEHHVIGLLLLTFLLRRRGWPVVYLGADVPIDQLGSTVTAVRPQLVVAAAQQLHTAATLLEANEALRQEHVPLAYGGRIFGLLPALQSRIAGHFLGERIDAAPQVVETVIASARPVPTVEPTSQAYRQAREEYLDRLGMIEADVLRAAGEMGISPANVDAANRDLALNIGAALILGDMEYLRANIEWVRGLISNYRVSNQALLRYFRAYYQAAGRHLDERGEPIVTWLHSLADPGV